MRAEHAGLDVGAQPAQCVGEGGHQRFGDRARGAAAFQVGRLPFVVLAYRVN